MIKKVLIATHNHAKLTELKFGLRALEKAGMKIVTLKNLKIKSNPKESGKTFKANAKIKARFYADLTQLPTIADDGGLIIPFLKNEPGVKSRRWLGRESTDEELINYTLFHLRGVTSSNRAAYLETCICFHNPSDQYTIFEQEKIKGYIAEKPSPRRIEGYPFRALFVVDKFNKPRLNRGKYYDDLTEEEHNQVNHRLKALKRLVKRVEEYLIE